MIFPTNKPPARQVPDLPELFGLAAARHEAVPAADAAERLRQDRWPGAERILDVCFRGLSGRLSFIHKYMIIWYM